MQLYPIQAPAVAGIPWLDLTGPTTSEAHGGLETRHVLQRQKATCEIPSPASSDGPCVPGFLTSCIVTCLETCGIGAAGLASRLRTPHVLAACRHRRVLVPVPGHHVRYAVRICHLFLLRLLRIVAQETHLPKVRLNTMPQSPVCL
jgi:hypothetical protein